MRKLTHWICGGCGETLRGIYDDGDFIAERELETQPNSRLWAVGCPHCGCCHGKFVGRSDDLPTIEEVYA